LNSWIEILDAWKSGVLYPHWAAGAHYGYGEVRFVFYPPFSWTLGAILGAVLPWKLVPAAFIWIVLTLAGGSMYLLARDWLPNRDAIFAAALYAVNPYHLVIVYWRSAWAEMMVAVYLPLLLMLILRMEHERLRIVPPLAVLLGAGWLTNVPGAVMMNYSLGLLVLCIAIQRRILRPVLFGAMAAVAGAAVAGVYLVPVFHERCWVHIAQVLAPGVTPLENFLFAHTNYPDHDRFNLLVSMVALSEIALLALVIWRLRNHPSNTLWRLLFAWSLLSSLLMWKYTNPLWTHFPELRFVQLPWRWLLCLNLSCALVVTLAFRQWWLRAVVFAVLLVVVLVGWYRVQAPWWDKAADIQELVDNEHDGIGNEGTDEYVPVTAEPDDDDQKGALARFEGSGSARIEIKDWRSESRVLNIKANSPGKVVVRLYNYPSWQVTVNGRNTKTATAGPGGQIIVPIGVGDNLVRIRFVQSWDRQIGAVVSLVTVGLLAVFFIRTNRGLPSSAA
jgi:hypothetical protein